MSLIHLKEEEREELRKIMRQTHDVRVYRRAQAILAMDRGERVQQISKTFPEEAGHHERGRKQKR